MSCHGPDIVILPANLAPSFANQTPPPGWTAIATGLTIAAARNILIEIPELVAAWLGTMQATAASTMSVITFIALGARVVLIGGDVAMCEACHRIGAKGRKTKGTCATRRRASESRLTLSDAPLLYPTWYPSVGISPDVDGGKRIATPLPSITAPHPADLQNVA